MILLDTNIVIYSKQSTSPHHTVVCNQLIHFTTQGATLVICSQVIYEFYVVLTRPIAANGFGMSPADAVKEIDNVLATYHFIDDGPMVFGRWKLLVESHQVMGKNAHDTRLVAFMHEHQIKQLYTLNTKDFMRFVPGITLL